jgi:hypothetical protein
MLTNNFHQLKDLFSNPRHFQPNKHSKNVKGKKLWCFQMLIFEKKILKNIEHLFTHVNGLVLEASRFATPITRAIG